MTANLNQLVFFVKLIPFYLIIIWVAFLLITSQTKGKELEVGPSDSIEQTVEHIDEILIPSQILIEKIDLNKKIVAGDYNYQQDSWDISFDYVYHALPSAEFLADKGTTLIYAHDSKDLFGRLRELAEGDQIKITDQNGQIHIFEFTHVVKTNRKDTSIFFSDSDYSLALLTCLGSFDQERIFYYFLPLSK